MMLEAPVAKVITGDHGCCVVFKGSHFTFTEPFLTQDYMFIKKEKTIV